MGRQAVIRFSGFRDLATANGDHIHAGTVVIIEVYSIQTGVEVIV